MEFQDIGAGSHPNIPMSASRVSFYFVMFSNRSETCFLQFGLFISAFCSHLSCHYILLTVLHPHKMVLAALTSVVLSTIIVLRLRGNLVVHGRRVHFLFSAVSDPADSKRITLAKQMLP